MVAKNQLTYALQIAMDYVMQMEVVEATCHVPQLRYLTFEREGGGGKDPLTRPIRSTAGFFLTYSVILPFSVKPQATSKGCGIGLGTPRKGTMLGCCNLLHTTTPPKNVYDPGAST